MTTEEIYKDISEFIDFAYDEHIKSDLTIIGKYESVQKIVCGLIRKNMRLTGVSEFYDPWINAYCDEYMVCVTGDDIFIEPVRTGGEYCHVYDNEVYILGDEVSAKILKHITGQTTIVYIDPDYVADHVDDGCDCETCSCKKQQEVNKSLDDTEAVEEILDILRSMKSVRPLLSYFGY